MEVFLPNAPLLLNTRSLSNELAPILKAIGIERWSCEKPVKKPTAWIYFLHEADGNKFLGSHGSHARSKISRLILMGIKVLAYKSNRSLNHFKLRQLQAEPEDHSIQILGRIRAETDDSVTFEHLNISCGNYVFVDNTLNFIQEWNTDCQLDRIMRFGRSNVIIKHISPSFERVVMHVPYNSIIQAEASLKQLSITLLLRHPPYVFTTGFLNTVTLSSDEMTPTYRVIGLSEDSAAHCLAYRFQIADFQNEFFSKVRKIEAKAVFDFTTKDTPVILSSSVSVGGPYSLLYHRFVTTARTLMQSVEVPFAILFQVQSLVVNNYLHPNTAESLLSRIARQFGESKALRKPPPFSVEAICELRRLEYPWYAEADQYRVDKLIERLHKNEASFREQGHMRTSARKELRGKGQVWVFRAQVTPSKILLQGPELESQNHVLRKYHQNIDCFLRVQFCDENGDDLSFVSRISYDVIISRIMKILSNGIEICGRTYHFLGFSHSSLRSRCAWFSAPWVEDGQMRTAVKIISMLGNFDAIRVPAKYAARIGQAFSETPYAISLSKHKIHMSFIPDIRSSNGARVFSDGVGTLSSAAMEIFWSHLPWKKGSATCFQIRLGGIKGMLSLDSQLKGKTIRIRSDSMMKFPSDDMDLLGVCGQADKPLKLVLNRQLIKILEDLGVPAKWFHRLQREELDILCSVTSVAYKTRDFLKRQGLGSHFGFPRFLLELDDFGIDYREDTFMRSAVENLVLREVRLLKHKSRIPVPMGATLYGIMDETAFLQENEVYVTLDTNHSTLQGFMDQTLGDKPRTQVLVTRSPALHPGDVQLAEVVLPPVDHPLRAHSNCIVFSQHGQRDLPSKLSGGDLDGDMYHVIWDPEAIYLDQDCPAFVKMFEAADYPRVEAPVLERQVNRDDIILHFINFMKSDQLGVIATKHMILSDQENEGSVHPNCVKLAGLHSTAVDFSKTGIPVDIAELQRIKVNRIRPDFLAPAPPVLTYSIGQIRYLDNPNESEEDEEIGGTVQHEFYKSEKVLGTLYRNIDERQVWKDIIRVDLPVRGNSMWDQFVEIISTRIRELTSGKANWARRRNEAWTLRGIYEDRINEMRSQFSTHTRERLRELEIFCGFIFNRNGFQTRRQRENSTKICEEMQALTEYIVRELRNGNQMAGEAAQSEELPIGSLEALERCWAGVMVGGQRDNFPLSYGGNGELESFRIVAASCLVKEIGKLCD